MTKTCETTAAAAAAAPDQNDPPLAEKDEEIALRFSPQQEAELVQQMATYKATANELFGSAEYEKAIIKYEEAVAICPKYLHYDIAVLRSNLAACHLKLNQWKEATKESSAAIEGLDKCAEKGTEKELKGNQETNDKLVGNPSGKAEEEESDVEEVIVSEGAVKAGPAVVQDQSRHVSSEMFRRRRQEDIQRIRAKALMRRARARSEIGGWSNLAGAEEDYKVLSMMDNLGAADKKIVTAQLMVLPPRTKAAQEKETTEMWGKLKELGNGILKPFGLSTENFQMQQDEKTGGYSLNFNQGSS